ncbi:MAG: PilZ domain-containing protein [gamma proteobacterium symbiont of Bathyaustriella thionipta]|nr:PilZ domain-containing protein [gamma proteobacterium symbiont of Bathyaustriella thionipta]
MNTYQPDTENRTLERWRLIYYLRVFDQADGSLLGHVVDISRDGLMLISNHQLRENQEYSIRMEVPVDSGEAESIEMNARSIWSKTDINPDFYDTGFELINPDVGTVIAIQKLIEELQF